MSIVIITEGKDISQWKKALQERRPGLDVQVHPDATNKSDIEFALTWSHPLGAFREYPNLKCIASMGAGVDHILKDSDLPKEAIITKLEDENLTKDMGTFVVALVMNHVRGLSAYKVMEAKQLWKKKPYLRIEDITIGIMGMGALGSYAAEQLHKLGFQVNGWARSGKEISNVKVYVGEEGFDTFLSKSDILVCLLPLTKDTEDILNKDTFKKLPENAFVINVARGKHLVDNDLIEMIDNGHLTGASLDVFREEPLPADHPFWNHPQINITPHIASVTDPASAVSQILDNYDRLQKNEPLKNVVSPESGY